MTFDNIYDMLFPRTSGGTVKRQHFIDWFDGDNIREWWDFSNIIGTGSVQTLDGIDQGARINTGAGFGDLQVLDFNDLRMMDQTACVCEVTMKRLTGTQAWAGLNFEGAGSFSRAFDFSQDDNSTNMEMIINDTGAVTFIDLGLPIDEIYHRARLEIRNAVATCHVDGILRGSDTTDLPTQDLQCQWACRNRTAGAKSSQCIFYEAYNTTT